MPLLRILTDRGSEYCGNGESHEYALYLDLENIEHTRTKPNGRTRASIATAKRHCKHSSRASTSNWIGSSRHPNQQLRQRSRRVRQIKSRLGVCAAESQETN